MAQDPALRKTEDGRMTLTPEGQRQLDAAGKVAEEIRDWFAQWYVDAEQVLTEWYLVFQDFGMVPPYYDPASLCSSQEEEWETFQ